MRSTIVWGGTVVLALIGMVVRPVAQAPAAPVPVNTAVQAPGTGGAQGRGRVGGGGATYPAQQRPPADPAVVARGRGLWGVHCGACHGADARGGDQGGPNLLRSDLLLRDQNGELLAPVVLNGRPGTAMVPVALPPDDIKAVATFLHSLAAAGRPRGDASLNVLVGNATAGQTTFASRCSSCHSVTDANAPSGGRGAGLRGIGTKIPDAKTLQNFWIMPRSAGRGGGGAGASGPANSVPAITATVTLPSGDKVDGRLIRLDEFIVTLANDDGSQRTFRRDGDRPAVEVRDPLKAHLALLPVISETEIHDLTAYLVTLK
jgi:cytochrome c oxidase cbb3-type subunit 3